MMLALGLVIALISVSVGEALSIAIPLADLLIIGLGIMLLLNLNPFKKLPQIKVPLLSNPYANAFVYGLLYGPIALPCSGPLVGGHLCPVADRRRGAQQAGRVSVVRAGLWLAPAGPVVPVGRGASAGSPACLPSTPG